MKAIKKINNNFAVCLDRNNNELIAFGKGLGFPKMPYEIKDLSTVRMTFYKLNLQYYKLLLEIPEKTFNVSAEILAFAQKRLQCQLNPNILFSLADHINFTLVRFKEYSNLSLPFSYDIAQLYPIEYEIGQKALTVIKRVYHIELPKDEAAAIAMHFINSQGLTAEDFSNKQFSLLTNEIISVIEGIFKIKISRDDYDYQRFVMHLRYFVKRIREGNQLVTKGNNQLFGKICQNYPKAYECTQKIVEIIDNKLDTKTSQEEKFYLMIYVKRFIDNYSNHKNKGVDLNEN